MDCYSVLAAKRMPGDCPRDFRNSPHPAAIQAHVKNDQQRPLPVSSSQPPPFPEEQRQLFREVLELFNRHGIPYAVSGAFALQKHTGIWRDTKDLDLFLPADDVPAALRGLHDDGFQTEVCDPVWLAKAHRG